MKATWQDEFEALREERRLILTNLHILRQRQIKESGRVSISTYHEIEDNEKKLKAVESEIKEILSRHTDAALELERTPFEESTYTSLGLSSLSESNFLPKEGGRKKTGRDYIFWKIRKNKILFILLITVVAFVAFFLVSRSKLTTDDIIAIHLGYYHLGDAPISQFHNVYPDKNPFIARFEINRSITTVQLSLTVSHVDPNEKQSPTVIVINGNFIGYLNSFVQEESLRAETIVIPLDADLFVVGTNEIKIEVLPTLIEYGQVNLDDFEFWDLKLYVK